MKKFVSYEEIRINGLKLAYKIYKNGFIPDIMYVSLRGGAYLGNIISEFFKFIKLEKPLLYAAVVARSYDISNKQKK
ncbi:Putative phosphoribosyl transferase domain-containing protein [Borrelia parkeri SLO]|nr:Putative phosphoribosyl transferase domain-containing protein [Borrelia parkeri SLO]